MNRRLMNGVTVLVVSAVTNMAFVLCGQCFAQTNDFNEFSRLSVLEGKDYKEHRDQLVVSGETVDVKEALKDDVNTGLAAHVVNARIANPEIFAELDKVQISQTRSGRPWFASPVSEGEAWQAFVIEQTWKGMWPEALSNTMIERSLMRQELIGSTNLWAALSEGLTTNQALKALGVFAMCRLGDFNGRAQSILADESATTLVKRAVLLGFEKQDPDVVADFLVETKESWAKSDDLRPRGVLLMARRVGDKGRSTLYGWVDDDKQPETMRIEIVNAMSAHERPGDLAVYRALARKKNLPAALRDKVEKKAKEKSK